MAYQHSSQFHQGEVAIQKKLGVDERVAKATKKFIRSYMPQQHIDFFSHLPFIVLGVTDEKGNVWCLPLYGGEGFITCPDAHRLCVSRLPDVIEPLNLNFVKGAKVGIVGIDLATRRRNRMNGYLLAVSDTGFSICVEQSFGNCPQYIHKRQIINTPSALRCKEPSDDQIIHRSVSNLISDDAKALIERADTCFIASRTAQFDTDPRTGLDASHRGGKPGFVKVEGKRLIFPDYRGNKFFNTLGNIYDDGRVGLFFRAGKAEMSCLLVGLLKYCGTTHSKPS